MKILIVTLLSLLMSGCCIGDQCELQKHQRNEAGLIRKQLFEECMTMASKIERVGDDDVSNIIEECDDYAFYTANHITN